MRSPTPVPPTEELLKESVARGMLILAPIARSSWLQTTSGKGSFPDPKVEGAHNVARPFLLDIVRADQHGAIGIE